MIKTVGAAGGVAAVGTGAVPHSFTDPAQGQELVCAAAGGVGGALFGGTAGAVVGATAGVRYCPISDSIDRDDLSDDREDRVYEVAESISLGKDTWEDIALHEYQNTSDPEQTPYGESAWTTVRTTTAVYFENGEDRTVAKSKARDRVKLQTTRAVINLVEAWNGVMKAIAPELLGEIENDWGQLQVDDGSGPYPFKSGTDANWSEWQIDGSGSVYGSKISPDMWSLPAPPSDIEGRDEGLTAYIPRFDNSGTGRNLWIMGSQEGDWYPTPNQYAEQMAFEVTHSQQNTVEVISSANIGQAIDKIYEAYQIIIGDIGTFVDNYYDQASYGEWESARAITPSQLYEDFASSGDTPRVITELAASGVDVPTNAGRQAKISHPDLPVDEAWGWLYPRLTDKTVTLEPGTTLASADYSIAYFVRVDASGNTVPETLSGDSDLQILDMEGGQNEDDEEYDRGEQTAGSNGKVVVWNTAEHGGTVPDPIEFPQDHSEWEIIVYGAENLSSHPPTDLTVNDTEKGTKYVLDTTALNEGELVESIAVSSPFGFEQPVRYVSDSTNIDPTEIQNRYDRMTDFYDQVREEVVNDGVVGVDGPDIDIPTLPGLGVVESVVVVVLGIFGLSALSN
jgi:hypothetical protein